jgi:galactokinase
LIHTLKTPLTDIYGNDPTVPDHRRKRLDALIENYRARYGACQVRIISTPGRTEIGGNHTDHNNGKVIAASINLDTLGAAARNNTGKAALYSHEFNEEFVVGIDDLDIREEEQGSTAALMRGILRGFKDSGHSIGGFTCYIQSDVRVGSGLSSSASIEVFIGTVLNVLYNNGNVEPLSIARIGQYAENAYFGKPCGLMDQIACAYGGVVGIDFENPNEPKIEKLELDMSSYGYCLLIVDTGGTHADLTSEYASVPHEMRMVAEVLGKKNCREITSDELYSNLPELRRTVHERPILRALHFLEENKRVDRQIDLLKRGMFHDFLLLVNESGNSSMKLLQNVYPSINAKQQPITLGLALTERYISSIGEGAVRVHGGGFAGTYQVFLRSEALQVYRELIELLFGYGSVKTLAIRRAGSIVL